MVSSDDVQLRSGGLFVGHGRQSGVRFDYVQLRSGGLCIDREQPSVVWSNFEVT